MSLRHSPADKGTKGHRDEGKRHSFDFSPFFPSSLCLFVIVIALARSAQAATYYIAANGSDSNSGTSKNAPWMHAPGMKACSSTCAATSPQPGDNFIFRGGDSWHFGNNSAIPYAGAQAGWNWTWNGSSGSPITIGVDKTWYSGVSWAKPVLTGDNPASTSNVGSCAYDFSSTPNLINLSASFVTFDNFEITGVCWSTQIGDNGMINQNGGTTTNSTISNLFCHGWTMTKGASDNFVCILSLGGGTLNDYNVYANDVFDGSDSPHFAAGPNCQWDSSNPCASGQGIYGRAWDVHGCTFRYLSNMMVTMNTHTVHDNLFENLYATFASGSIQQHPNVINNLGGVSGDPIYFYNNIMRHTYSTENVYLAVRTNAYIFNNVFYDNMNSIAGPGGCFRLNSAGNSAATQTAYIYNNTLDPTCQFKFEKDNQPLTPWSGTGYFENNHLIGSTAISNIYICNTSGTCTVNDNGNELYQTMAVANAQGYTAANNYAPTAATNATVTAAGANLSSVCSTFSADNELCSGTSAGGAISMVPRPGSGAWNVGAYQFSSGATTPGNPCDVNGDVTVNVADVQGEVNQALGTSACKNDINQDGSCNVIDVQRVVNASLGGQCVTTP